MKIAIVHDWLTGMRGGEKVLEAICDLFPQAPIYTLIHIKGSVSEKLESHLIRTSFLQRAPLIRTHYRNYLPVFPTVIKTFDVSGYDLIISSSHCVAKGVIPSPSATHICYCHTPMRYIWSHYEDYFGNHRIGPLKRSLLPLLRSYLCSWDVKSNQRIDQFVVNSKTVAERVRRFYGRESTVVYPPVDVDFFTPSDEPRESFFLIVSALVPYKRIEVAVQAFNRLPYKLKIVGIGPEEKRLKKTAGPNVEFLGRIGAERLRELYRKAFAFVQTGEEDFGISVVEALSCRCPIIAYAKGGVLETVVDGETGLFFNELDPASFLEAVDKMNYMRFNKTLMRESAQRFSPDRFKSEFLALIQGRFPV